MQHGRQHMTSKNGKNTPIFESKRFFYEGGHIYDLTKKLPSNKYERSKEWYDPKLLTSVEDFIKSEIAPYVASTAMDLYTVCKYDGNIYRANPLYKNKRAWNDWAHIDCNDEGRIYQAQFILFIHIHGSKPPRTDGLFGLCHLLPVPLSAKPIHATYGDNHKAHQGSLLFEYSQKKLKSKQRGSMPDVYLVDTELIIAPCIAVPDLDETKMPHSFIFVKSRCQWQHIFLEHMREELESQNKDTDDDEAEDKEEEEDDSNDDDSCDAKLGPGIEDDSDDDDSSN